MRTARHAATQPPIRIFFWMGVNGRGKKEGKISDDDSVGERTSEKQRAKRRGEGKEKRGNFAVAQSLF